MHRLLLVTGGHAFDATALGAALDSLLGWTWTRWNHPEAERRIGAGEATDFDALLFHDMAGYRFGDGLLAWARRHRASRVVYLQAGDGSPVFADPNFRRLLAQALDWAHGARR